MRSLTRNFILVPRALVSFGNGYVKPSGSGDENAEMSEPLTRETPFVASTVASCDGEENPGDFVQPPCCMIISI